MKHYRLIWAGVWSDSTRTAYTLVSIFAAFVLFGMLQGITSAFNHAVAQTHLDRLYVDSRFGVAKGLPLAALGKIERVPGVTRVTHSSWFGGSYQDARQPIFALAVDPQSYLDVYSELLLPKDQVAAWLKTRDGVVVSRKIAERYHWKIGDRIPLRSSIWSLKSDGTSVWSFQVVGIFDVQKDRRTLSELLLSYAYFDEARQFKNGTVGWYIAQIADPAGSAQVADAIDAAFANSSDETLTQNEQEKAEAMLKQHGDIDMAIHLIIGAVFFTLLLLTGNTMMQSVRERVPEFAVLKTIGYSTTMISLIVLCEAMVICIGAASLGLLCAWLFYPILQGATDAPRMPAWVLIGGVLIAMLLAIATAIPSTERLRRVNVVDALAGR
ncbi:ABC transporter permease [Dyella flagellata]|uniref:Membrane protein n=1 Tax=Dyella flagellata TaxID=1867833 RepID=A0ABQ5X9K6_9GAMM|nr:ABC transporter permease [Dyella flagellata]GLQ87924.1 membrane protein [Dyella flagellata]